MTRVLMLGWEYPPHISGGLGTACEGLTKGLARHGTDITFVVPQLFGDEPSSHMRLVTPSEKSETELSASERINKESRTGINKVAVPAFLSPYHNEKTYKDELEYFLLERGEVEAMPSRLLSVTEAGQLAIKQQARHYGNNIFAEVERYAQLVLSQALKLDFDVIHAHDWMTYPAAIAVAKASKKPLVVHVHSLEYDRSGNGVNKKIHAIEQYGTQIADAVISVSEYTRQIIHSLHHVPLEKIHVVHNGIYPKELSDRYRQETGSYSKVVLFLGRVTFQKGPDYFVEAAAKVVKHIPDALFILAGSGDMLPRLIDRVHQLGIQKNFHFPGFLRGAAVERAYSSADLYVMPSVSEPFGISALEAINCNIPVLISKQSGVAEVIAHALKFDFWDVDRLADLMINGLIHQELREDLTSMAREELKKIRWDIAASKTIDVYSSLNQAS